MHSLVMMALNLRRWRHDAARHADTTRLAGGAAAPRVGPGTKGLDAAGHRRGARGHTRSGQPVALTGTGGWDYGAAAPARTGAAAEAERGAAGCAASAVGARTGGVRLPWGRVDDQAGDRADRGALRRAVPPGPRQPPLARDRLEPAAAHPTGDATRRGGRRAVVRRALAGPEKGADQEGRTVVWLDE